jgi:hypothetical protein
VLAVKQTLKAALPSLAMPAVISLQLWVLTAGGTRAVTEKKRGFKLYIQQKIGFNRV